VSNDSNTIGGRFALERLRLKLGVQELADLCEVSRQQINRIERAGNSPGGEVLASFARAGADVGFVLAGVRSGFIDLNLLGLSEAALRHAYEQVRPGRPPGPVRARMSAMVYNSVVGTLSPGADEAAALRAAAQRIVEGLDDPADPEMLDRNLWAALPTATADVARVSVQGDGNQVAGRDMVRGSKSGA
jgi:transcriptional regulator with XRE-family HTH domain